MIGQIENDVRQYVGSGQAAAIFGMFLPDKAYHDPKIHVLSSDMSVAASLDRFIYLYPDKYTEVGIAEQNLIGIASGMASEGFSSIAVAQAAFIAMRAFEMDRQYLGYMRNKVILVGLNSGFFLQFFGNTHYCIEDLALFRVIPNMTVISPADAGEAVVAFDAALRHDGPVYLRLTGGSQVPTVYKEKCTFQIGKNNIVKEGRDVCFFATGACVGNTITAAELLEEKYGIKSRIVDVHTLKPLDVPSILETKEFKLMVSVEEHSVIGGLGSAIAEAISEESGLPPLLKLGVRDVFSQPGNYDFLLRQHRLSPEFIAEDIFNRMKAL